MSEVNKMYALVNKMKYLKITETILIIEYNLLIKYQYCNNVCINFIHNYLQN
jgi:hypothetical protein